MAIRITCPGCKTALTLSDDKRGKKVRCKNCEKVLNIPAPKVVEEEEEELEEPQEEEQQDEEERPAKKKKKGKKSKKGASSALLIGGAAVLLLLVLGGGGGTAFYFMRGQPIVVPPAPKAQAKVEPPEGNPGGQFAVKGGGGTVQNVRNAVRRTERQNEMKQIGTFYTQFSLGTPNSGRTEVAFLNFIKTDSKAIHDAIKDGYYKMNMKAEPGSSSSIVAYESDADNNRPQDHLCVRGDGSVDFVSKTDMKAAGIP